MASRGGLPLSLRELRHNWRAEARIMRERGYPGVASEVEWAGQVTELVAELRDDLHALSNRVESLTRAMNERGHLHSVKAGE